MPGAMDLSSLRTSPRLVAPVALAIFAIALLIVVITSTGGGTATSPSKASAEKQRDLGIGRFATTRPGTARRAATPPNYVVKSGDTLASIAQKTGVSVGQLQQLNPNVSPQALLAGEKLKLR